MEKAAELFAHDGVNITLDGERHIGAVIGSQQFKEQFVNEKVEKWVMDVHKLSCIAKEEPQSSLSAFNTGMSQRWKYLQRTVSDIEHLFEPLEKAIREKFIPALCGRTVSDLERHIFALPYRYGGMGILNPVQTARIEYESSCEITAALTALIYEQDLDLTHLDTDEMERRKVAVKTRKDERLKEECERILSLVDVKSKRLILAAQEKGASPWFSALPLSKFGYTVNRQEFQDAICLRYGWRIKEMPSVCGCGQENSVDHVLICKKGGYVSMRHNALRDTEGKIMSEVCHDVKIEPRLLQTDRERTNGNAADGARLDIAARGVWSQYQQTFFDVRVCYPNAESYRGKSLDAIYRENENQKKRAYNDRILNKRQASHRWFL